MKCIKIILLTFCFIACGQEHVSRGEENKVNRNHSHELLDYTYFDTVDIDTLNIQFKIDNGLDYFIRKKEHTFYFSIDGIPRDNTRISGPGMTIFYPKDSTKNYRLRYDGWTTGTDTAIIVISIIIRDSLDLHLKRIEIPVKEK